MPTPTNYTYSIPLDCPGGAVNPSKLQTAIRASSIVTAMSQISTYGGTVVNGQVSGSGSTITIYFNDVLSTADRTTLDGNNGSGGTNGSPSGTHPAAGLIASTDNTQSPITTGEAGVAAMGSFAGQVPTSYGRAFGYLATSATSSVVVRATVYTPQTNAVQRSVSSSNTNDTLAGTGAQKVKITYYDNTCAGPFTDTINLNGTTAVNTNQTNIAFIEKMEVTQVGADGTNDGTITLFIGLNGGGGGYASIAPQDSITYWCHHYVPTGTTCYVTLIGGSATINSGSFALNSVNPVAGQTAPQTIPDANIRHNIYETSRNYPVPIQITGPSIIFLTEKPDNATASTTYATFHWIQFN